MVEFKFWHLVLTVIVLIVIALILLTIRPSYSDIRKECEEKYDYNITDLVTCADYVCGQMNLSFGGRHHMFNSYIYCSLPDDSQIKVQFENSNYEPCHKVYVAQQKMVRCIYEKGFRDFRGD